MDLEQDDWVGGDDDNESIDDKGNGQKATVQGCLQTYAKGANKYLICSYYRFSQRTGRLQKSTDVFLWPGGQQGPKTECRRRSRTEEETHRYHRGTSMEERRERQCRHPFMCGCIFPWLFCLEEPKGTLIAKLDAASYCFCHKLLYETMTHCNKNPLKEDRVVPFFFPLFFCVMTDDLIQDIMFVFLE